MKNLNKYWLSLFVIIFSCSYSIAQTSLGDTKTMLRKLKQEVVNSNNKAEKKISLTIPGSKTLTAKVNYVKSDNVSEFVIGEILNTPQSSFYLKVTNGSLEGHIILKSQKRAYKYYSDNLGKGFVKKVDINTLICVNYTNPNKVSSNSNKISTGAASIAPALLNLQSLPGAAGCVMLDFDGYNMPAGNLWNNGNAINAAPSGMSDADIQQHWEVVSEDYRPFNLNITTNESVFNSYPKNRRMRVVITPTNTAAPGAGGVAYIGSFNWDNDVPCWVFITSGKSGGDASSHEIGHTFDLGHDGRTSPAEEYFVGLDNTSWAPIMGAGYYRPVVQWSRGEYNAANNLQDDVATIAGTKFGIGYRGDDYGNNTGSANNLDYNSSGVINQKNGIISSEADYDFFSFTTGGGNVVINAKTVSRDGNLHLLLRLYNSSGTEIGTYWNSDPYTLNATMNVNLAAGKYYLGVDGNGAGNAASGGYSAYGSIGSYNITGTIPPGGTINPTTDVVTVYKDCNHSGFSGGLNVGDYTLSQLVALGVMNDDVSSIKIAQGYKAILYMDDNFLGSSVTLTSDSSCFDATWNDKVSSIRVRPNGVTTLAGKYTLQNRYSGLNMDVVGGPNGSSADGVNIQQWNVSNTTNQQFNFEHLGDGVYKISAVHSGKCIDVNGISKDNGANVQQWTYYGTPNQQFIVYAMDAGYYKLIAKHSGKVIEVAGYSTVAEANVQQWENVNQASGHWKLNPVAITSTVIQAENYSTMSGIQVEATTDTGGGSNVAYCDTGDWMAYNSVNFPTTGSYLIEYRVASAVTGAKISSDLNAGSIVLGTLNVPNTGGWQNWQTISHTVNVNAGTYNFGIFIQTSGVNINWIKITKVNNVAKLVETDEKENELKRVSDFSIFPNPTSDYLYFSGKIKYETVKIINSKGETISKFKISQDNLDVSNLPNGDYFLEVESAEGKFVKRFIKK